MNTELYQSIMTLGENTPIFDLDRAYSKGRIDERLEIIKRFERKDAGYAKPRFKSAINELTVKTGTQVLRENGFFALPSSQENPTQRKLQEGRTAVFVNLLMALAEGAAFLLFAGAMIAVVLFFGALVS